MKPILFNTQMVQAILEGRKSVTRRVIKIPKNMSGKPVGIANNIIDNSIGFMYPGGIKRPQYKVGDILYVRETWQLLPSGFDEMPPECWYIYKATDDLSDECTRWRPSIHMPKEAARVFLKVTDIRVERLQDITPEQMLREGLRTKDPLVGEFITKIQLTYKFMKLWNNTIKKQDLEKCGWKANPWVWVIEFERVDGEL